MTQAIMQTSFHRSDKVYIWYEFYSELFGVKKLNLQKSLLVYMT